MKTIGILGGMGPEATLAFYQKILDKTPATRDQEHIPTLIYSNPQIPDRTETFFSQKSGRIVKALQDSARVLEQGRADFIVVPCISAHLWVHQIQQSITIPVINMVEATLWHLTQQRVSKVGLLGTLATMETQIFQKHSNNQLEIHVPPQPICYQVMEIIRQIKGGDKSLPMKKALLNTIEQFEAQGIVKVILGCTDLPLLFQESPHPAWLIDPMEILADIAVKTALGN